MFVLLLIVSILSVLVFFVNITVTTGCVVFCSVCLVAYVSHTVYS